MSRSQNKTQRLVRLSLFAAIALTLFILEAQIPSPITYIPGIKLGLANIVTLYILSEYTKKEALMVLMVRIFLGSFFAGQIPALIYSLAGGLLSFAVMCLCVRIYSNKALWFTGAAGGVFHNIGQIAAAARIMQTPAVFSYLPFLVISGICAGLFCGAGAFYFVKCMNRLYTNSNK
ncbi:MAG: Gx transporter family protein [Oscillospiraceae bacterium]|nr:Gx transporter family protein [Oscillospiraceae bacterium]